MTRTIRGLACAALGIAMMLGLTGCGVKPATSVTPTETVSEVRVSASSTIRLVPDKATVSFGVTTQEQSTELAQSKNSEAVKNVIEVLTGRGVEEKSIRTTYYSMYPQYDWSDGEQRITGYNVTTTMSVQDQNIEDLGTLLSACVGAGITNIDNVSFLCSGYDEAYRQALAQAIADSRLKAETLAAASGKTLGEIITISEGWQDTSSRYGQASGIAFSVEEARDTAAPSLQPGETEIVANVTVAYRMK